MGRGIGRRIRHLHAILFALKEFEMILLGLDLETTGLDPLVDSIIEAGFALWDTDMGKPVRQAGMLIKPESWPSDERWSSAEKVHGVPRRMVEVFGVPEAQAARGFQGYAEQASFIVAHNGTLFDKLFMAQMAKRHSVLVEKPWIDTRVDLPEPMNGKLVCLAANAGFLNPFPHNALSDALTMLRLLSKYDIAEVCRRALIPTIIVHGMVDFGTNQLAKDRGYYWEPAPVKQWRKAIKECDLAREESEAKFRVRRVG